MNYLRENILDAFKFEDLIKEILTECGFNLCVYEKDMIFDFEYQYMENEYLVEVKYYLSNDNIRGKLISVCDTINKKVKKSESQVVTIICGNIVNKNLKEYIVSKYKIYIVDISNLLFITQENDILNNKLISLLNYSISNIIPEEPPISIILKCEQKINEVEEFYKKLKALKSGQKYFSEYEKLCTNILKYLFGDYLTLWDTQRKSNNDLYRFDLCCKIKYGEVEEFFDTIRNYFRTKYVIFEFKNCRKSITQKEIYTTEKYLYTKALRAVSIIISRKGTSKNANYAIKGCLRESGKLIISLSDEDLINMLKLKKNEEYSPVEYLSNKLDELLLELEK